MFHKVSNPLLDVRQIPVSDAAYTASLSQKWDVSTVLARSNVLRTVVLSSLSFCSISEPSRGSDIPIITIL